MLNETFYLDGIDAQSAGIQLQAPIEFSEAIPVVKAQTIPGRNGDLIRETGSYKNRSGSASCFCLQKDVEKAISAAGRFLMGKRGYRRLETSDDPDHYWMARVKNSPRIAQRMRTIAPFEIDFDCKPQRFLKSGQKTITIPAQLLANSNYVIHNQYGFDALPIIKIFPNGTTPIYLTINGKDVMISELPDGENCIILDSETQNAYNENGNRNNYVKIDEFPVLKNGENTIVDMFSSTDRLNHIEIIPRWWEL